MKIAALLLSLLSFSLSWTQKMTIQFECSVVDAFNLDSVPNAELYLLEGNDTVFRGSTNEIGKLNVELVLDKRKTWKVVGKSCGAKGEQLLHEPKDSSNYKFDLLILSFQLNLYKHCALRDPNIYYDINDIKTPVNIDSKGLVCAFSELNKLKLEFCQIVSKKEKPKRTEKRIKAFEDYLRTNGLVPASTIINYGKTSYLDENDPDQRARVQMAIISLD